MFDIICYVEVDETPTDAIRWNGDGSMFMTADFRWHEFDGTAIRETAEEAITICQGCGGNLYPTGKPGRPAKRHPECRPQRTNVVKGTEGL